MRFLFPRKNYTGIDVKMFASTIVFLAGYNEKNEK